MTKKERNDIISWTNGLSNDELEKQYYDCVYDTLGTQVDAMVELDYDTVDILERIKYEKFLGQKADLLGFLCEKRGIVLWKK